MLKKIVLVILTLMAMPIVALAKEGFVYDFTLLNSTGENILEVANLIIAIMAAVFAVKLAALSQGGSMEKTWNKLAFIAMLFALLEIYGSLKGLGLVQIEGLGDIIELAFGSLLLITVYTTRKTLLKKLFNK